MENAKLVAEIESEVRDGKYTQEEHQYILRYYFGGINCIISKSLWEQMLAEGEFRFAIRPCHGRNWYT